MNNIENGKSRFKFLFKISFCIVILTLIFLLNESNFNEALASTEDSNTSNKGEFCYLSDIPYVANQSAAGWKTICLDKTTDGALISVRVEGAAYTFEKGIWAHATSTVVYDLTGYSGYDYFTAYVGLNTTAASSSNGVKFYIYTSDDGKNWNLKSDSNPQVAKPGQDATFMKVDIKGAKFLKLYADANGNNGNDHSVYADAKLIKSTYKEPGDELVPSIEEMDARIKEIVAANKSLEALESNKEYEFLLLKRELVKNAGNYALKKFLNESPENQEAFRWLVGNKDNYENLKLYVLGGLPDANNYYKALTILSNLYNEYSSDFNNTELLNNPTTPSMTYGHLYKKMAMSISLTHSQLVGLWMQSGIDVNKSEPLRRYAIFKYIHKNGGMKISDSMDMTHMFEDLHIQEMRMVVSNNIDDEEILWLNRYVQDNVDSHPTQVWRYTTPHPYIAYVWPNYANPVYYAEENVSYFNELFAINKTENNIGKELVNSDGQKTGKVGIFDSEFVIPGGKNIPEYRLKVSRSSEGESMICKVWMNFRNKFGTGCVCGGISKSGANIRGTHGIPAGVIGQPGHAALLFYSKDEKGRGYWRIDNDVSGWTLSGGGGRLLRWGSGTYTQGFSNGVYVELEQAAINDYQNLMRAQELVMLAKIYDGDLTKQEEIYRKALEIQSINFDAWLGLIGTYNANENKTENDCYNLAEEVAENLKYYPLPMYNATNLIKQKVTSIENNYRFTLLQTRALTEAKNTPNNTADSFTVVQPGVTRLEASYLLGQFDSTIATFSFDGDDAGKIVLASRFDGNGVRWDYCINGNTQDKNSWKEVSFSAEEEHKLQLTDKEIESLTAENDIYVHIVGVNYDEKNLYKIDIKDSVGLPSTLYANDQENRMIAAVPTMQWKYKESDSWKYYRDSEPDLTGDKTIIVRMGATGEYLAQKTTTTFTFTADNDPDTRKYIPIANLELHAVSSEATNQQGAATNAIDGNANTRYHSNWGGGDMDRYIVIKLNEPTYISAVEFIPAGGGNGKILDGTVYGSIDGENWEVLDVRKNWTYTNQANTVQDAIANKKSFEIENPSKVQYIKIVSNRSSGGNWFTARMFNFYKDITIKTSVKFSFDGPNAGKIMIDGEYKNTAWQYSIDNGKNWINANGVEHKLTDTEINNINENDKIKVRIQNKEYIINIRQGEPLKITPYVNDLENRLIGITDVERLEWKLSEENTWKSYSEEEPVVTGDRKLLVRAKANGIYTASDILEYQFTADNQPDTEKYVSIKHLSIEGCSTESPTRGEPVGNAIDGNINTMWHTDHTKTDDPRFIIIKLDEPRYISKLQYAKKPGYLFGVLKDAVIYTSMDGENWEEAANVVNLYNPANKEELIAAENIKDIPFGTSKQAQYIKLQCTKSCDYVNGSKNGVPYDYFLAASMLNVFEDITKNEEIVVPTAEIKYNITNMTNKDVVATIVNPSTEITITNNNGKDTYTFTENGEFTFEFVDNKGTKGTVKAIVNWIDKDAPVGKVTYNINDITGNDVVATLTANEDITIVNNNGKNTYTFTQNGEFEFVFRDKAGNEGKVVAKVDWIDKELAEITVEYDIKKLTNKDVTARIVSNKEITITNNNGKDEYTFTKNGEFTFKYVTKAGKSGEVTVKVDWIDKEAPVGEIEYNISKLTNKDVIATLVTNEDVIVINNEGRDTYTFTEDGEFEFVFRDEAGNESRATAKVCWIDKEAPIGAVQYDITELTNKDVTVTLVTSEDVIVLNNNGKDTYTFTENGEFEFVFRDEAGNEARTIAVVDWIDKEAPEATISYDITEDTIQNVVATIECDEEITIVNNDGETTYTFTENGEFEFIYTDKLGNEGRAKAKVNWIDRDAPIGKISYNITNITGNDVIATLETNEDVTVVNNNGKDTYTFTENGEFEFIFTDKAGNEGRAVAKVDWIDKELPEITVVYDIENITNKDVTVKIVSNKEITITNNDGKDEYTFTENGEFTFEYVTKAGKRGEVIVKVDWIDKEAPIAKVSYDVTEKTTGNVVATLETNEDVIVLNNNGKDTYVFTENGEFEFVFRDKAGNEGKAIAKVDWIIEEEPEPSITPTPSDKPTPTPSDKPTPTPSDKPTPTPSDKPTPTPSDKPTPSQTTQPTIQPSTKPSTQPTQNNNSNTVQNNTNNKTTNKTTGNNLSTDKNEDKTTEAQVKTTTSNNELPYTGYENIGVAFRRIFLIIAILALLIIAAYSYYNMKKE